MKTYFICSDIHGFYNEWMSSLNQSGFDIKNENHILIILGDIFDRGPDPWKIYKFIKSLEPNRAILVKGNHEYLLLELINRKIPFDYDYHNGTYQTLISLYKDPVQSRKQWLKKNVSKYKDDWDLYDASFKYFVSQEKKLYNNKKINEIVEWLKSSSWLNYFELGKYIFVHSFIPLKKEESGDKYFYYADWRSETNQRPWELST